MGGEPLPFQRPSTTTIPPIDPHDVVRLSGEDYDPNAFGYLTIQFDGTAMHVTAYAAQLGATSMQSFDSFDVSNRESSVLPTLTITSPAGGENWLAGTPQTVSWTLSSALPSGQFRIYLADAAGTWFTLKTFTATAGQTVYPEPVTLPATMTPGSTCRIWVYWRSDPTVNTWQLSAKSNAFTVAA
jgi:hypothetical protein